MIVRRLLHAAGFRYRLHRHDLPGKPDIVFPSRHKAILVHGCFWHQHRGCHYADRPSSNTEYWRRKLDRNVARDAANSAKLKELGWDTLVVWECETRDRAALVARMTHFLTT